MLLQPQLSEREHVVMITLACLVIMVAFAFLILADMSMDILHLQRATAPRLIVFNNTPAGAEPAGAIDDQDLSA